MGRELRLWVAGIGLMLIFASGIAGCGHGTSGRARPSSASTSGGGAGKEGPQGPTGPEGSKGEKGSTGATGPEGKEGAKATTPTASGEENKVVVGTGGSARKIVAAITGNAIATTFKIKDELGTQAVSTAILTSTFEEPVTMLAKAVATTINEVEVTFSVAPGKGVVNYVVIVG